MEPSVFHDFFSKPKGSCNTLKTDIFLLYRSRRQDFHPMGHSPFPTPLQALSRCKKPEHRLSLAYTSRPGSLMSFLQASLLDLMQTITATLTFLGYKKKKTFSLRIKKMEKKP